MELCHNQTDLPTVGFEEDQAGYALARVHYGQIDISMPEDWILFPDIKPPTIYQEYGLGDEQG